MGLIGAAVRLMDASTKCSNATRAGLVPGTKAPRGAARQSNTADCFRQTKRPPSRHARALGTDAAGGLSRHALQNWDCMAALAPYRSLASFASQGLQVNWPALASVRALLQFCGIAIGPRAPVQCTVSLRGLRGESLGRTGHERSASRLRFWQFWLAVRFPLPFFLTPRAQAGRFTTSPRPSLVGPRLKIARGYWPS